MNNPTPSNQLSLFLKSPVLGPPVSRAQQSEIIAQLAIILLHYLALTEQGVPTKQEEFKHAQ